MPGHDSVCHQRIGTHLFDRFVPPLGYVCYAVAIVVEVDVMTRPFFRNSIAAFVGIDGRLNDVVEVLFVKATHFWRQCEDSETVDVFVAEESPAGTSDPDNGE